MDKYTNEELKKAFKKAFKKVREKNAIEDLFDKDRYSETSSDSEPPDKVGVVNKADEEDCTCKGEKDCECDKGPMDKSELLIKNIVDSFKKVSDHYFEKKEMQKAKVDQGLRATDKKKVRAERQEGFTPKTKEKFTADGARQMPKPMSSEDIKGKLREKHGKNPPVEDLEYPMAANEDKKPFKGYNKNKHSKKGGMSEKAREKYNRENDSNLKAPVSSKEANKSPKKASRRKSFCARMSGNKGPTSKDGKLTPKGAALKRWDC